MKVYAFLFAAVLASVEAYSILGTTTKRSVMEMKRGRGSFKSEFSESPSGRAVGSASSQPMAAGSTSAPSSNWMPVSGIKSMKDLGLKEGSVKLVDTMVKPLVDGATNPTGAVSVIQYQGKTYCTSASCTTCKIPLNKAKILDANEETGDDPRLVCDFCASTYNARTGDRVTSAGGSGLLGGIVKGLFSKNDEDPLPVYALGEKNGKVFINIG